VRDALRVLQDRFNVRDKISLVGDVDFEYGYMSEEATHRVGIFSVAQLAGLYTEPGRSTTPGGDAPPELLGADAQNLIGRNRRAGEEGLVLVLRRPPPSYRYREDITTAAQDYSMAERRLLRWDLDYLFESIPPEVSLFMTPTALSIQGTQAEVTVDYEFRTMVDTPLSASYAGQGGTLVLRWRKIGEEWHLEQLRTFVDQIRAALGLEG